MDKSVYKFQEWLNTIARYNENVPRVNPDGNFGPETTQAVKAFQLDYGLRPTGEIDFDTWNMGRDAYNDVYEMYENYEVIAPFERFEFVEGVSGTPVYILQVLLRDIATRFDGLTPPESTGVYDSATIQAVAEIEPIVKGKNVFNGIIGIYNAMR